MEPATGGAQPDATSSPGTPGSPGSPGTADGAATPGVPKPADGGASARAGGVAEDPIASATGSSRRQRILNLATAFLTVFALVFMAGAIADVPSAFSHVKTEHWFWLPVAVLFALGMFAGNAFCLTGAADVRVPMLQATALEVGESFTAMATPGGIGSFAITVRYFERKGLSGATAATSAWLASVSNTIVDTLALVVALALSASQFDLGHLTSGKSNGWLILVVVILAAALVTIVWHVPRLRNRIVPQIKKGAANLRAVLRQPRKAVRLFAGQVLSTLFEALCLYATLALVGLHTSFAVLVVVTMLASTAQYAVPVPGALGAPEALLVAGLTSAGLANPPAVAAALSYRMLTYWLPPIPGWLILQRLRHRAVI